MQEKRCPKCDTLKPVDRDNWYFKKSGEPQGYCKPCWRAYISMKKKEDPEKTRRQHRQYFENNREKYAQWRKEWGEKPDVKERLNAKRRMKYLADPEHRKVLAQKVREYRRANPHLAQAWHAADKARRRGAEGSYSGKQWLDLLEAFLNSCAYCGKKGEQLTPDHVIPIKGGGTNYIDNILPVCGSCNSSKQDTPLDVWLERLGIKLQQEELEQAS